MFNGDLFRHLDDIMKSISDIESHHFGNPWNDQFTRFEGNFYPTSSYNHIDSSSQRQGNSLRDQFLDDGYRRKPRHADEDLDQAVANYGVNSVLGWQDGSSQRSYPTSNSYYKSFTFSSNINGNRVEERKVQTDSSGRKIESYTRQLGDKVVSVTSKASADGVQEVDQNLVNLDEDEIDDFEKEWKTKNNPWFSPWSYSQPSSMTATQVQAIEDSPRPKDNQGNQNHKSWLDKIKSWVKL